MDRLSTKYQELLISLKQRIRTNLLYMRALDEAYSEEQIVQQVVGQIPWGHNLVILDKVKDLAARRWYAQQVTLCRSKNGVVAEYALRDINKPIGVAEWTQALTKSLPDPLQSKLPSIEELEAELGAIELGASGDG